MCEVLRTGAALQPSDPPVVASAVRDESRDWGFESSLVAALRKQWWEASRFPHRLGFPFERKRHWITRGADSL